MKKITALVSVILYLLLQWTNPASSQVPGDSSQNWTIVASYTIPGKASGLAWDGTYIYFGIYGYNNKKIYKFDPSDGTNKLQCSGSFSNTYGLTYKNPNLATINQPSSTAASADIVEFNLSGTTVFTYPLPFHFMSGIAFDNGNWWVCSYYPGPAMVYKMNGIGTGAILNAFTAPSNEPWDICMQGNNMWIADYNANMLYKVTDSGTIIESHPSAGPKPSGVVYDGTYLWYCDGEQGSTSTLYKVDMESIGIRESTMAGTLHLLLYPNPNEGMFQVRVMSNNELNADFRITDLQGRVLHELNNRHLNNGISIVDFQLINILAPGMYFLEVKTSKSYKKEKLIIKK